MSALVTAARRYLGTPFRHRGRTSAGLDCAGLAWVAYRDCGLALPDFRLYGPEPHDDGLIRHITAALGEPVAVAPVRPSGLRVGDVLVLRFDIQPHHVGIVGDYRFGGLALIHADGHNRRVLEHRLSEDMAQRITHVFRRPV
jgi:cell wall-associated NlpC family hydrolase